MTGFLDPTEDQMNDARLSLDGHADAGLYALHYVGAVLNRFAAGNFDSDSIRRAVAMYRVWDVEIDGGRTFKAVASRKGCPRCGAESHGMACPALLADQRREQDVLDRLAGGAR